MNILEKRFSFKYIAFFGHSSWQHMQRMHLPVSKAGYGFNSIASTGHCFLHIPHLMHASLFMVSFLWYIFFMNAGIFAELFWSCLGSLNFCLVLLSAMPVISISSGLSRLRSIAALKNGSVSGLNPIIFAAT